LGDSQRVGAPGNFDARAARHFLHDLAHGAGSQKQAHGFVSEEQTGFDLQKGHVLCHPA
jgi:hypothetical protein